jgi:DNA ligase (NAD+)
MNIDGLGEETVDLLFSRKMIKNVADLYDLKADDLAKLDRLGEKSAGNIINSIRNSVSVPFSRVLFALGIRHVGETVAKTLASHFNSLESISKATADELIAIDEIGDKIAASIIEWFMDNDNIELVRRLSEYGLQVNSSEVKTTKGNILEGKNIVVSGVFNRYSRDELKTMIEEYGGRNVSSISAKTSFILAGENMGPAKRTKAEELGIEIINEEEFLKLINNL